LKQEPKI